MTRVELACAPLTVAFVLAFSSSGGMATPSTGPVLDDASLHFWLASIRPTQDEQRWRLIPWRSGLQVGLEEAGDKPLLLWLMNGHPLGCT